MTIRMIGALFLTLSGACYALESNRGQSQRLKLLRNLSDALYYIEWELKTNLTPLDELIQTLSGERSAGNAKVFFKNLGERLNRQGMVTFPQCWCAEVQALKDSLTGEEQDALHFGGCSGAIWRGRNVLCHGPLYTGFGAGIRIHPVSGKGAQPIELGTGISCRRNLGHCPVLMVRFLTKSVDRMGQIRYDNCNIQTGMLPADSRSWEPN